MKFDDDNMTELVKDSFAVVNYDKDTLDEQLTKDQQKVLH